MTTRLPKNSVWKQNNYGDKFDDLWASFNLDLTSKLGSIKVSPRLLLNTSSTDQALLGVPTAFAEFYDTTYSAWAIAGTTLFHATDWDSAFTAEASVDADFTSAQSDLAVFNGSLYATAGANRSIWKITSAGVRSELTNRLAVAAGLHATTVLRSTNRLYYVDDYGRGIGSIDTGDTAATLGTQYTLNLLVDSQTRFITWIKANSTRIFIGTINPFGQRSTVYSWDGSQLAGANDSYELPATGSLSCVIKDDMPVILDTSGRLWQLNGGTFTELDKFPYSHGYPLAGNVQDATTLSVHRNGMAIVNEKVSIFLNSILTNTAYDTQENMPSGIWEWTRETGLYHKASPGIAKVNDSLTDFGQRYAYYIGALHYSSSIGGSEEHYICGLSYFPATPDTAVYGIFRQDYLDTKQKYGSLITSKIYSPNLQDSWKKFVVRLRKLITSSDRVILKYRTAETERREIRISWTSTTSFTTSTDISTTSTPYPAFEVGDEVTILSGTGAGKSAHITALQTGATQWLVTLDETFTGATGDSVAHVQKWKKISTLSDQSADVFVGEIGATSTWIQFKVCFLAQYKDEINDLTIINSANEPNS